MVRAFTRATLATACGILLAGAGTAEAAKTHVSIEQVRAGSKAAPWSAINWWTGTMAPSAAIMVPVPTSNTWTMAGCCLARKAAMAPVMASG